MAGAVLFFVRGRRPANETLLSGRNVFADQTTERRVDPQSLASLAWDDVSATAEGLSADRDLLAEVSRVAAHSRHSPAVYLRGLLLLAANDTESALTTFLLIRPEEIPPSHLYGPYRLHNVLRPSEKNPFQDAITRAVAESKVPPLIQARVLAAEGRLQEALKAYLKTDPASWTDWDLRALRPLRIHSGLANDTGTMLLAALKGGRVPESLRPQIIELIKAPVDAATLEDLKRQFLIQVNTNPLIRQAAITGAVQQLAVRQKFVGKKYRALLDEHAAADPKGLPDETVLMLTLSGTQLQDVAGFNRWSKELKRRYPTKEIDQWLNQLRPATR